MKRHKLPSQTYRPWQLVFVIISGLLIIGALTTIVASRNANLRVLASGRGGMCTQLCQKICTNAHTNPTDMQTDQCNTRCTQLCNQLVRRNTPKPTPIRPIHNTPTPQGTMTHTPTAIPASGNATAPQTPSTDASAHWHAPGAHDGLNIHEHGDKPPTWADEFSQKNFNHPVVFGGDEATPNENALKHQAYKGFSMRASGVDIFIRYHSMSAPTDRSGPLHSYEVYTKDPSGNVSFWQGWIFHGYPEHRDQRMARHNEQPGFDAANGINWPGRNQFIIAGADKIDWDKFLRCEQWYGHAGTWSWDLSITICGATTYYSVDEHLGDIYNKATWKPTGSVGGSRRLEVSHYGPTNPSVTGEQLPFDRWFCVKKLPNENRSAGTTPTWSISNAVSGPNACQEGWLPQYVAGTFPKVGIYFQNGNTAEKDFPTTNVTIPN